MKHPIANTIDAIREQVRADAADAAIAVCKAAEEFCMAHVFPDPRGIERQLTADKLCAEVSVLMFCVSPIEDLRRPEYRGRLDVLLAEEKLRRTIRCLGGT